MADQYSPFDIRLSNQQAIKRVFVVVRQLFYCQDVSQRDRQYLESVCLLLALDEFRQRQAEPQLAELELDLHFPNAGNA